MTRTLARLALHGAQGVAYAAVCVFGTGVALSGCLYGLSETALTSLEDSCSRSS